MDLVPSGKIIKDKLFFTIAHATCTETSIIRSTNKMSERERECAGKKTKYLVHRLDSRDPVGAIDPEVIC